jgi:CRISPR type III-A-associated protein Csm2
MGTAEQRKEKRKEIDVVIDGIRGLCSMSCIDPKKYAMEEGWAHAVARDIQNDMKVNQLRKFFGSVKHIKMLLKGESDEDKHIDDIEKVKPAKYELFPELAYALARKLITKKFYELMKLCLQEKVISVKDFDAFEKFLSAIVAYYKMCEWQGKQSQEGGE